MPHNSGVNIKEGETASKYSIISNIVLMLIKGIIGYLSGI